MTLIGRFNAFEVDEVVLSAPMPAGIARRVQRKRYIALLLSSFEATFLTDQASQPRNVPSIVELWNYYS